jgi:hypothetical protein
MYIEVGTIKPKWGVGVRWGQHSQLLILGLEFGFFSEHDDRMLPGANSIGTS